jgi:hypothetical protein
MTDKERFLSDLKLLCNKYAVTLGKSKHYRSVCGEQVLLRTSPAFISKDFVLEVDGDVYTYLNMETKIND